MITVCHVFDETAGWEPRSALQQLLDRLPGDRYAQVVAATSAEAIRVIGHIGVPVHRLPRSGAISRFLDRNSVDLIHAWGPRIAASMASAPWHVVAEVFDPRVAGEDAKWFRAVVESERLGIACAAEIVRRRLLEKGVPPDRCTVIRPGVDFQLINQLRRRPVRQELGVSRDHALVIVPPAATRNDGSFEAFWAVSLLNHLEHHVRVVLPGDSHERRRIARFASALPTENALILPATEYRFEELLAHADVLLVAGRQDASTTAIAWAMAAGVPVIAAATRANAELIAHKVGGLLYKTSRHGSDAAAIVRLLKDRESQAKAKEVASGQAYEVFGLRRYIEQHVKLYENVLEGRPACTGIEDPALAQ